MLTQRWAVSQGFTVHIIGHDSEVVKTHSLHEISLHSNIKSYEES